MEIKQRPAHLGIKANNPPESHTPAMLDVRKHPREYFLIAPIGANWPVTQVMPTGTVRMRPDFDLPEGYQVVVRTRDMRPVYKENGRLRDSLAGYQRYTGRQGKRR